MDSTDGSGQKAADPSEAKAQELIERFSNEIAAVVEQHKGKDTLVEALGVLGDGHHEIYQQSGFQLDDKIQGKAMSHFKHEHPELSHWLT